MLIKKTVITIIRMKIKHKINYNPQSNTETQNKIESHKARIKQTRNKKQKSIIKTRITII
jgi:hypothetical protein